MKVGDLDNETRKAVFLEIAELQADCRCGNLSLQDIRELLFGKVHVCESEGYCWCSPGCVHNEDLTTSHMPDCREGIAQSRVMEREKRERKRRGKKA